MTDSNRDDFSPSTKELIAKRSGYICAYPGCQRMTIAGSNDRSSGITNTGIAAHITAASLLGPRYDSSMSADERKSERNGIWTCQIHGKFIDDNPSQCSIKELKRWKKQHEEWVFNRVESGLEQYNHGITQLCFNKIGIFSEEYSVSLGRHNILFGGNDSGKTTLCELVSAFSGAEHWKRFNKRFDFSQNAAERPFIEITHLLNHIKNKIRISPQYVFPTKRKNNLQKILVEINDCVSPYMPSSFFNILFFDKQLYHTSSKDPQNTFIKALRYLANVLGIDEEFIWGSLGEDLFSNTTFGYRFKRIGKRKVTILVPDGRDFYLPHGELGFTEQHFALLDIALKIISSNSKQNWLLIFDIPFFQRMDSDNKIKIFNKLISSKSNYQTLFCLHSIKDVDMLKKEQFERWINAEQIGNLTMHSFL
jgi:hypothetical protein